METIFEHDSQGFCGKSVENFYINFLYILRQAHGSNGVSQTIDKKTKDQNKFV